MFGKKRGFSAGDDAMKLDFKRTLCVGFAFMGIMCFWEVYDYIMPLILSRVFGMNAKEYGAVMAVDNMMAIFLLPLFGHLSDKFVKSKLGRRTSFILVGTILAVIFMIIMILIENAQYNLVMASDITDPAALAAQGRLEAWYDPAIQKIYNDVQSGVQLSAEDTRIYNDFLDQFYAAQTGLAAEISSQNRGLLAGFIIALLAVLVAMASYRSPAIALMPDVTPKPLRSQANALITFMGGAGGLVSIILYTLLAKERYQSHIALFCTLGAMMIVMLIAFMFTVRENKFVQMRYDEEKRWNVVDEEQQSNEPLSREKKISFALILATVFMWFMGWNAIKTHLSTYATTTLKFEDSFVGIINILNGAGGAIALVPVALLAAKFGRKKTILTGVVIAVAAFIPCIFLSDSINEIVLKIAFTSCFLIAGFGLVIINVNTLPMVTELAKGSNVGQYTGYYYVASMTAQAITPIIGGAIMDAVDAEHKSVIFIYGIACIAIAFVTMFFTKHGDNKPERKKKVIEYFGDEE